MPPDHLTRNIPPGREALYRRQAEADAEVDWYAAELAAAERRARHKREHGGYRNVDIGDAEAYADTIHARHAQAQAVASRIHVERTAGLSAWIDECPHLPVCTQCGGTGGPPGSDAHTSCRACRGWGRENDGTPATPVWHDADEHGPAGFYDPATGRPVDLLAGDGVDPIRTPARPPAASTTTATTGGAMASIDEVRAGIAAANEQATEGLGALQQAHTSLEQAQGALMRATEGSGQADVSEANGLLAHAVNSIEEVRQQVSAAIAAAESVANRL